MTSRMSNSKGSASEPRATTQGARCSIAPEQEGTWVTPQPGNMGDRHPAHMGDSPRDPRQRRRLGACRASLGCRLARLQCMPDGDVSALPPNAAARRDRTHFVAGRVLDGIDTTRELAERGRVSGGRRVVLNGLMGPLLIELSSKGIEARLLRAYGVRRRTQRLLFERAMHALMPSVLLGVARLDALMANAECQSPASWGQVPAVSPPSWGHPIARVMGPLARRRDPNRQDHGATRSPGSWGQPMTRIG